MIGARKPRAARIIVADSFRCSCRSSSTLGASEAVTSAKEAEKYIDIERERDMDIILRERLQDVGTEGQGQSKLELREGGTEGRTDGRDGQKGDGGDAGRKKRKYVFCISIEVACRFVPVH